MHFTFAQQVQPRNGNMLADFNRGITGDFRAWTISDAEEFPQAARQLAADECLIVDRFDGTVFRVDLRDAKAAGIGGDTVEVSDGNFVRADAL